MARIYSVFKYILIVIVVLSAGFIIERFTEVRLWWETDSYTADDDFVIYNASMPMASMNFDEILSKRYRKCLTEPSKLFCLLVADKRLEIFRNEESPNVEEIENRLQNITSDNYPRKRKLHSLLVNFTRFMKISNIKVLLIEPSMLFCLLSSSKKFDMLKRGFNPGRLQGSRNVVTVGILSEDSKRLKSPQLTAEMISAGFKIVKFHKWIEEENLKSFETVHYFFILQDVAVHAVIFYPRSTYLWHAGLDPKEIDFEGLLFVNEEIFENFTLFQLNLAGTSIHHVFVPHHIQFFMKEIESSEIIDCRSNSSGIVHAKHFNLTQEQLAVRTVVALKELKAILEPSTTFFWLWSKTLLGWFTECDVFHHSTTLDLALTFNDMAGLNLTDLLADNEFLKVMDINETDGKFQYKLQCHGLLVNVYVIYEDTNHFWYRRGEEIYKFPLFTLCSSQIFGEKIHVPCNTVDVLKLEYAGYGTKVNSSIVNFLSKINLPSDEAEN